MLTMLDLDKEALTQIMFWQMLMSKAYLRQNTASTGQMPMLR
jgi:hypothetical protein